MTAFQLQEEFHEILRLAARFGKHWPWVAEYLHCFQSAGDKPLKPSRIKIILEEILGFLGEGGFRYDGKAYVIRSDAIHAAIKHVAQTNKTGFKNHNYMKKVAIDFNQKIISQEEREQKLREEEAAHRMHRNDRSPGRIREIIKSLG
jgi:hypothetical protein